MENLVLNERTMHILFIYNIRILKRYQDKKEMGRRRYHAMGGLFVWELEKLDGDAVRIMQIYHLATRIWPLIVGDGGTDGLNVMIFGCGTISSTSKAR